MLPDKHHHIRYLALGRYFHKIGFAERVLEQKTAVGIAKGENPFGPVYIPWQPGYQSFKLHAVYRMAEIVRVRHDMIMRTMIMCMVVVVEMLMAVVMLIPVGMFMVVGMLVLICMLSGFPALSIMRVRMLILAMWTALQQFFKIQVAAHRGHNRSIRIPALDQLLNRLFVLIVHLVHLIEDKRRGCTNLLLHQTIGLPLLLYAQMQQMRGIHDGD